jgi:hypothetical protein
MAEGANPQFMDKPQPDPALQRLERLVGTWDIKGRTLGSTGDNIRGKVTIEWLPGGFFLQLRGEMQVGEFAVWSLEIVGYDPSAETFPSAVYSDMGGTPVPYQWDIQGKTLMHSGAGAKYTGTFSQDGNTIIGGWRPVGDQEATEGNAYDAIMTRVE